MEWYWIALIVASCMLGILLVLMFLIALAILPEHVFYELVVSDKKKAKKSAEARRIAQEYHIPDPPDKFCEKCGRNLSWHFVKSSDAGYHSDTGRRSFRICVSYQCPEGHYAGPAEEGAMWWTHWDTTSNVYRWEFFYR